MKKLLLFVLLFISVVANAQKGISYQAVILDPSKIEIPGQDISGQPFVNGNVNVKFVILSGTTSQFEEVQQTKTDAYGLVNLTIGSVASTTFNALTWDANQKSLQVFVSFNNGASYTKVSDQKLTYTPYALFSETAGKLGGTLEIANGGTGATTAVGARSNLGLGNVDNTTDASKPISTATQAALDLKASSTDLVALSATVNTNTASITSNTTEISLKAPIASPTFTGTVSGVTKAMVGLGSVDNTTDSAKPISEATQTALDLKASTADLLALSATVNTNTASITSNTTEISLKAPIASPTFTGTVSGVTKSMVGLGSVDNTTDAAKPISEATQTALDLKASTADLLALSATVNTNTVSITSNTTEISLKAPIASPTFTGITTATGYKIPNGTSSEYLMADGSVSTSSGSLSVDVGTSATGVLPIINGGTGSSVKNFVDLSSNQSIVGGKSFTENLTVKDMLLGSPASGSQNTMLGTASFVYGSPGDNNTALGFFTLSSLNGGSDNTAVGTNALRQAVSGGQSSGNRNTAVGSHALSNSLEASDNVGIGVSALPNTTGGNNIALGNYALYANTTGSYNTANGSRALYSNTTGYANTASGSAALSSNTSGLGNTATGDNSLQNNTIGILNTASGNNSLRNNSTGSDNTASGAGALYSNTTGGGNTANGRDALISNTTGSVNVAHGMNALNDNTTGGANVASGYNAMRYNITGGNNTAAGNSSLYGNTSGTLNTAIGVWAGATNATGNNNTAIGGYADFAANNLTNATALGYGAVVSASNTIQLGADGTNGNAAVTNVKTSGTITAGDITYPKAHGTSGQVLSTTGSGTLTWTTPTSVTVGTISNTSNVNGATIASGVLNLTPADASNGGIITTGSQTLAGSKTFSNTTTFLTDISVNGLNIGRGLGSIITNTSIGNMALPINTSGEKNAALGYQALQNNTSGVANTALGYQALQANRTGASNVAIGHGALLQSDASSFNVGIGASALTFNYSGSNNIGIGRGTMGANKYGSSNVAIGSEAGYNLNNYNYNIGTGGGNVFIGHQAARGPNLGSYNTAIGFQALNNNLPAGNPYTYSNNVALGYGAGTTSLSNNNTFLGAASNVDNSSWTNATAIGYNAQVTASNTIQLGNASVTNVNTSGALTANVAVTSEVTSSFTIDANNAETYKGKIIICNPSAAITITFGSGLPNGFNCMVLQKSANANKVTFAGTGATIYNRSSYTATAGQYAMATILHIGGNVLVTAGDMQ